MAVSETVVEVVRFTEKGVSEVAARTKVMGQQVDEVVKRQKVLLGLLADPRYLRHQSRVEGMRKQYELMGLRARNLAAAQALADGSAAKHIRSVQRLNAEYAKTQRTAELVARYGQRTGRFLARYGGPLSAVGGAAAFAGAGVAAAGVGFARSGFAGTVEEARFQAETKQLARELAAVMKPVMELMTKGARLIRQQLERLDEGGQNLAMGALMLGGTAAGTFALRYGARALFGGATSAAGFAGSAGAAGAASGAAGSGFFGGMTRRGAVRMGAGLAGAGLLAHGAATDNPFTGAAGGAMVGWMVGGPVGAVVGTAAGAAASAPAHRSAERPSDYYLRMREEGRSRVGAGFATAGRSLAVLFGADSEEETRARTDRTRRSVTLAGGGFEESGAAYDRLSAAIEKVEGARPDSERELTTAVRDLAEEMRRARGEPPLPRPGER